MTPRRRRRRGCSPSSPLEDDDLLWEILLRLPPQVSSLPRASAVCKRWLCVATDPRFLRSFRVHHRKPPLLGIFHEHDAIVFTPILDAPDCIPPERFDLGIHGIIDPRPDRRGNNWIVHGHDSSVVSCRHGRVLIKDPVLQGVVVCDPITGEQHRMSLPPDFHMPSFNGAVICAARERDHVHGGCHSSPFNVVLVSMYRDDHRPLACVYSSETGVWGNLITTAVPFELYDAASPGTLVGNALYWLSLSSSILEFDLGSHSLAVIEGPPVPVTNDFDDVNHQIIRADDGAVGMAILSYPHLQMWQRKINGHGVAAWLPSKTVEMHNILGMPPRMNQGWIGMESILGYSEDTNEIFIIVDTTVYMVQLKSMQSRRLHETRYIVDYHPFTSFYTPDGRQ